MAVQRSHREQIGRWIAHGEVQGGERVDGTIERDRYNHERPNHSAHEKLYAAGQYPDWRCSRRAQFDLDHGWRRHLVWPDAGRMGWCGCGTEPCDYWERADLDGTTVEGPGTISFYWRVSSESNHDFLRFYIGSSVQASISGSVSWEQKSFSIPQGNQTLRWSYSKDSSVNSGSDCGWVDNVVYSSGVYKDELVLNFGSDYGLYQYDRPGGWNQWNTINPSQMVIVDLNGDGADELVADFPGYGLYKRIQPTTGKRSMTLRRKR